MEVNGVTVTSHIFKGLVLAAVLIVYALTAEITHASQKEWFLGVWILIFAVGVIWGVVSYGAQMQGNVNFSTLMVHGLKLTAVVTCMYFIFSLLEMYVFFPHALDEIVKQGFAEAAKAGTIDQEKFAAHKDEARKVVAVMRLAGVVMGTMVAGLLASLVGCALAKKTPGA
jgi:hypothetical protein